MKIKDILNYDSISNEHDVLVTDDQYTVMCYYYGTQKLHVDMQIINPLSPLSTQNIYKEDDSIPYVKKLSDSYYAYELCGVLIKRTGKYGGIVKIGEIYVDISYDIPKDIKEGEFITFTVDRLDLI